MGEDARISIWFFIGSLLTAYGIIIFIVNVPSVMGWAPEPDVVLAKVHAGLWWGILLFGLGIMYVKIFWPGKNKDKENETEEEDKES